MTILEEIASSARRRVIEAEKLVPLDTVIKKALQLPRGDFAFKTALSREVLSFICEVKKASPSRGIIAEDFPYIETARSYERAGADAISVLTEPDFFHGSPEYLKEISAKVNVPTLRKDFIVGEYQIYEAKTLGASAILLICAILSLDQLSRYTILAKALGLSVLTEAHSEDEIRLALDAGADIIGVNNRDLHTFEVDLHTAERLRRFVPDEILFIAESGISAPEDISELNGARPDGVLIGEALMRADDKSALLLAMREAARIWQK